MNFVLLFFLTLTIIQPARGEQFISGKQHFGRLIYRLNGETKCITAGDSDLKEFISRFDCGCKVNDKNKNLREVAISVYYDILFQEKMRELTCQLNILDSFDARPGNQTGMKKAAQDFAVIKKQISEVANSRIGDLEVRDYKSPTRARETRDKQKILMEDCANKIQTIRTLEKQMENIKRQLMDVSPLSADALINKLTNKKADQERKNKSDLLVARFNALRDAKEAIFSHIPDIDNPYLNRYIERETVLNEPFDKNDFLRRALDPSRSDSYQKYVVERTKDDLIGKIKKKRGQVGFRHFLNDYEPDVKSEMFVNDFYKLVMHSEDPKISNALYDLNCALYRDDYKAEVLADRVGDIALYLLPVGLLGRGYKLVRAGRDASLYFKGAFAVPIVQSLAEPKKEKFIADVNAQLCDQSILGPENVRVFRDQLSDINSDLKESLAEICKRKGEENLNPLCGKNPVTF